MYDSTNIYDIPITAEMVGYYVDGIYAIDEPTVRARFPNAVLVGISAVGTNAGVVGDVEPGCMTPSQAVIWLAQRRAAGVDPTIYINQNNGWQSFRAAMRRLGLPEPHYWVANYDRVIAIPLGAVAKQYTNPTYSGGHYDLSCVADFWPGVDSGGGVDMTPEEHALLQQAVNAANDLNLGWFYGTGTPNAENDFSKLVDGKIRSLIAAELAKTPVSVAVPTNITGTITGKIS